MDAEILRIDVIRSKHDDAGYRTYRSNQPLIGAPDDFFWWSPSRKPVDDVRVSPLMRELSAMELMSVQLSDDKLSVGTNGGWLWDDLDPRILTALCRHMSRPLELPLVHDHRPTGACVVCGIPDGIILVSEDRSIEIFYTTPAMPPKGMVRQHAG